MDRTGRPNLSLFFGKFFEGFFGLVFHHQHQGHKTRNSGQCLRSLVVQTHRGFRCACCDVPEHLGSRADRNRRRMPPVDSRRRSIDCLRSSPQRDAPPTCGSPPMLRIGWPQSRPRMHWKVLGGYRQCGCWPLPGQPRALQWVQPRPSRAEHRPSTAQYLRWGLRHGDNRHRCPRT